MYNIFHFCWKILPNPAHWTFTSLLNLLFNYFILPLTPPIIPALLILTFDTQQPRNPERNSTKSCCTICLKKKNHLQLWAPPSGSCFLIGHSFNGFGSPSWNLCQTTFCITFYFTPSIIGSHKNNLYYQCRFERRVTTSLPPLSEGLIMGWKEPCTRAEPGASWRLSLLMAAWGLNCSSFHTVASLSPSLPSHSLHCTCHHETKKKRKEKKKEIKMKYS